MLVRIKQGKYISSKEEIYKYPTAYTSNLVDTLEKEFSVSIPLNEIRRIDTILSVEFFSVKTDYDTKILQIINILIADVKSIFSIDLAQDKLFFDDIKNHLKYFLERNNKKIPNQNPLLQEIKDTYFLEYDLALNSLNKLTTDNPFSEDKIGFLTLHLRAAIERNKNMINRLKLKFLLVCGLGIGTTRLLETRINNFFGEKVSIVGAASIYEYQNMNLSEIDAVLSTIPLPENENNILQISALFNQEDRKRLTHFIVKLERIKVLESLFDNDLFVKSQKKYPNYISVIHDMCRLLKEKGLIDIGFEKGILEREALSSTVVKNQIAIPHSLETNNTKPFICVFYFRNSIQWNEKDKVHLALLFNIPHHDVELIERFQEILQSFTTSSHLMTALDNIETIQDISFFLD